mmetsp:Transcript_57109/g.139178  ORF Transcript_57109/g.139178 Transcript_57109/m.139178 type:complete len:125 (+) Transcript_57109:155-529(+)
MFAVIFKAITTSNLGHHDGGEHLQEYLQAAAELRRLACEKYGCLEFYSVQEEIKSETNSNKHTRQETSQNREVTISYWPDEAHILAWKQDPFHRSAQKTGREKWYERYSVEVVEMKRKYTWGLT